ncbi:MAG TPA: hypothetical protein PLF26_00330, partial [Blastocatellia bacterium]|nr:hypothetical protein [Blastocatellia bacterium]
WQETHAVRVGPDGWIHALAIGASAATTNTEGGSVSVAESNTTAATKVDYGSIGTSSVPGRRDVDDAKSALFKIMPDGSSDVVWSSKSVVGYSLLLDGSRVLVGTGDRGRVIAVDPATLAATVLLQSTEDQTSTLLSVKSGLFATSNNLGKLFRIGPASVAKGTYDAPVHDAKSVSTWGRLVLRSKGTVSVESRSGNTETPDSTWSAWAPVALTASSGPITSPSSRYLQWRVALTGAGTEVSSVAISYLPRNAGPDVTQLVVLPAGIGLQDLPQQAADPGVTSSGFDPSIFGIATNLPPRRVFQTGARSLIWQAKDPEGDRVTYGLYFKSLTDSSWHPLATGLTNSYYTIDSAALPDGVYLFKVVADDLPSNPSGLNRTGERVTEPVEIDNTPPVVSSGTPTVADGSVAVQFDVVDATSRVIRADYSVDGGPWVSVYPEDGIPDSGRETFRVRAAGLAKGEHVISFRATDSNVNIGTAKVTATVR